MDEDEAKRLIHELARRFGPSDLSRMNNCMTSLSARIEIEAILREKLADLTRPK